MPTKCNNCLKRNEICRVQASSGVCGNCHLRGAQDCDVKVTALEWKRLKRRRTELRKKLLEAQVVRAAALDQANAALAKQLRIERQLELLENEEHAVMAGEDREILALEMEEGALPTATSSAVIDDVLVMNRRKATAY